MSTVRLDKLTDTVNQLLREYGDECTEVVGDVLTEVAKETAKKVRDNSKAKFKRGHGNKHYANGWRSKVTADRLRVNVVVYNATKPQLTHLLENGHAIANGTGRVEGRPHIAPADEWAQEEAYTRITERLRK